MKYRNGVWKLIICGDGSEENEAVKSINYEKFVGVYLSSKKTSLVLSEYE